MPAKLYVKAENYRTISPMYHAVSPGVRLFRIPFTNRRTTSAADQTSRPRLSRYLARHSETECVYAQVDATAYSAHLQRRRCSRRPVPITSIPGTPAPVRSYQPPPQPPSQYT
jgi:hypothetical protein